MNLQDVFAPDMDPREEAILDDYASNLDEAIAAWNRNHSLTALHQVRCMADEFLRYLEGSV